MWTLVIAVGGLVIALFAVGWNVYLHAMSRPKLKVTASIVKMYPTPPGLSDDVDILYLEAVNLRPRPVTLKGFYGKYRKPQDGKSYLWIKGSSKELAGYASAFPIQMKEGDVAKLMTLVDNIDDLSNVKFFFASDTTGRDWYSRGFPLRKQLEKTERPKRTRK